MAFLTVLPLENVDDIKFDNSKLEITAEGLSLVSDGMGYDISNPSFTFYLKTFCSRYSGFVADSVVTGSDEIRFVLVKNGVDYYFNGTEWVESGAYAWSNTETEIDENIGYFPITVFDSLQIKGYLHSADGTTTPILKEVTLTAERVADSPDIPLECQVSGNIYRSNGEPEKNAVVRLTPTESEFAKGNLVSLHAVETLTDDEGHFELSVIRSDEYNNSVSYNMSITPLGGTTQWHYNLTIPNQDFISLDDLLS